MTLIAAFRCHEGIVLCADQQETVGGVRVAVNKLKPEDAGENYRLAIAGSGNGDLIDGFAYKLKLDIANWDKDADEQTVYGYLVSVLQDYHENEIAFYPADSADDKLNHFLVCIKPKDRPDIFLWELRGTAIVPVGDYTLIGVAASIYHHELKRLYKRRLGGLAAVLLGIHLFSIAKQTSNYVGGSTDVVFVRDNGMTQEDPTDVAELEARLAAFNSRIAGLVLLCPDTSQQDVEINAALDAFREEVMGLRQHITKRAAANSLLHALNDPHWPGDPYNKLPLGQQFELKVAGVNEEEAEAAVIEVREKLEARKKRLAETEGAGFTKSEESKR